MIWHGHYNMQDPPLLHNIDRASTSCLWGYVLQLINGYKLRFMFKISLPGIRWCSGTKGKNVFLPSPSLESPALTPRFIIHFPISTSSAPPASWRQISLSLKPGHYELSTKSKLVKIIIISNHCCLNYECKFTGGCLPNANFYESP